MVRPARPAQPSFAFRDMAEIERRNADGRRRPPRPERDCRLRALDRGF
jgi:hypothetical protein